MTAATDTPMIGTKHHGILAVREVRLDLVVLHLRRDPGSRGDPGSLGNPGPRGDLPHRNLLALRQSKHRAILGSVDSSPLRRHLHDLLHRSRPRPCLLGRVVSEEGRLSACSSTC